MKIEHPYLLFLGDAPDRAAAKTAVGIAEWRPDWCLGQVRLPGCGTDLAIPDLSIAEAAGRGARALVLGVVNRGGVISPMPGWTSPPACMSVSPTSPHWWQKPGNGDVRCSMCAITTGNCRSATASSGRAGGC